ncbi:phage tail family protein [Listeria sp. FSL L7-1582]|uniref:phage tail domain-containing protein n=1 Tax=Listeria portnoyi TaxID=2713504 RepID=UPI00164CDFFA|nr:phage tail domain-containing protein [Listeria portnoyi]MBC6310153.1 phage tail family protein [Listeria portnoyi]
MQKEVILFTPESQTILTDMPGFSFLEFSRSDASMTGGETEMEGIDGLVTSTKNYAPFTIELHFLFDGRFPKELMLRRLRAILHKREWYYVYCSVTPGLKYAVNKATLEYDLVHVDDFTCTITFQVFRGLAQSRGSTLSDFTFSEKLWQLEQGIRLEDISYQFQSNKFQVYNAGDIDVDPRRHAFDISIQAKCFKEFTMINKTTNETYIFYPELRSLDELVIQGPYSLLNGNHCTRDTNRNLITLAPGFNVFEIKNASAVQVGFDFDYWYV